VSTAAPMTRECRAFICAGGVVGFEAFDTEQAQPGDVVVVLAADSFVLTAHQLGRNFITCDLVVQ